MLLYEMLIMLIAIGIAVVLVVAAIDRLVMGPEEMALLRLARAATAQRRESCSSPAPPRGRSSPAGAGSASRSSPAPPRGVLERRTRGTAPSASRYAHHSTRNTERERLNADRELSYARARAQSNKGPALLRLLTAAPHAAQINQSRTDQSVACCARAASGHAAAAPPSSVMNSRLFTRSPRRRVAGESKAHRDRASWRSSG
jgi:hypothetical protein